MAEGAPRSALKLRLRLLLNAFFRGGSWGVSRFDDHHGFHPHQLVLDGTLGAVPMTEQAVWGVGSAGKPRAPTQEPAHRNCLRLQLFPEFSPTTSYAQKKKLVLDGRGLTGEGKEVSLRPLIISRSWWVGSAHGWIPLAIPFLRWFWLPPEAPHSRRRLHPLKDDFSATS